MQELCLHFTTKLWKMCAIFLLFWFLFLSHTAHEYHRGNTRTSHREDHGFFRKKHGCQKKIANQAEPPVANSMVVLLGIARLSGNSTASIEEIKTRRAATRIMKVYDDNLLFEGSYSIM